MHVPRNIYAIRLFLPTWRNEWQNHSCNMKLLVADNINYFRNGPRDLPKEVTIHRFLYRDQYRR